MNIEHLIEKSCIFCMSNRQTYKTLKKILLIKFSENLELYEFL